MGEHILDKLFARILLLVKSAIGAIFGRDLRNSFLFVQFLSLFGVELQPRALSPFRSYILISRDGFLNHLCAYRRSSFFGGDVVPLILLNLEL